VSEHERALLREANAGACGWTESLSTTEDMEVVWNLSGQMGQKSQVPTRFWPVDSPKRDGHFVAFWDGVNLIH
jgi:hypothetical protein